MRKQTEFLLWALVIVAIFWVAASDPWFIDNWLRIVLIVGMFVAIAAIFFLAGVSHGIETARKNHEASLDRALDEQSLKIKRQMATRK